MMYDNTEIKTDTWEQAGYGNNYYYSEFISSLKTPIPYTYNRHRAFDKHRKIPE